MLREIAGGTGVGVNSKTRQRAGRAAPAKPLTTARSARLAERESHKGLAGGPPGRSHKPEVPSAITQGTTLMAAAVPYPSVDAPPPTSASPASGSTSSIRAVEIVRRAHHTTFQRARAAAAVARACSLTERFLAPLP